MKKVYIVEDDPLTSSLLATTLQKFTRFEASTFDDAPSAARACETAPPALLIIDYQLPGMSGIELFEQLKPKLPSTTLTIMASAIDDGTMVLKFIQKGIRHYVIKDEYLIQSIYDILAEEGMIATD